MNSPQDDTLSQACRVLFGPEAATSRDFLCCLKPSGISKAFRKKALATHPDRLIGMDDAARKEGAELFIRADWARTQLMNYCRSRDCARVKFYSGPLPQRRLRFGEFLYYSGVVSWNGLIKAIIWQRRQRPRFGEIARRWRYLSEQDLRRIMSRKKFCEPIGETAVRINSLSKFQVNTILFHQMFIQRPIGDYFVEQGHVTGAQVDDLLRDFKLHNDRFLSPHP